MFKKVFCFCLAMLIVPSCVFSADDSRLTISGAVKASVCTLTYNPKTMIGTFTPRDFPTIGSVSAFKAMSFNLTNCYSKLSSVIVKFSGIADSDDPTLLALTTNSDGKQSATGIGVELMDNAGKTIPFNKDTSKTFYLDEGFTTLSFLLRYKSTKHPVTSGEASSVLYFDLTYQ